MKVLFTIGFLLFISHLHAQFLITPRLGMEYTGLSGYSTEQRKVKRTDIRVFNPDIEVLLGGEVSYTVGRKKLSLIVEKKHLSRSIQIINDSFVSQGYDNSLVVSSNNARMQRGNNHLYAAIVVEQFHRKIATNERVKLNYGIGLGIALNGTPWHYQNTQGLGYTSVYWGGDNYYSIVLQSRPNGVGVFLHVSGGFSCINKKRKEVGYLKAFWSKGLRPMIHHTIHYKYGYLPAGSGSGRSVSDYHFISRGTTFGIVLGFPIRL